MFRYIGYLIDSQEEAIKALKNPVIWLREGFSLLLLLPLLIFNWLGIIGNSLIDRIHRSLLFKILTGLVALIGVLSVLMTIILGWDTFIKTMQSWLP